MPSVLVDRANIVFKADDAELVAGCINKDRLAQHRLYNKYAKRMMTLCYRYSKSREEAEDTLNEGFMRVFDKIHTFKATGSLEGWLRKVIVNVAIEKFRKNHNPDVSMVQMDAVKSNHVNSVEDVNSSLNAKELIKLVQKLPPTYQMVFNLYVFEGLGHKEIADQIGISEGTSKSNLHDARAWLKKNIESNPKEKVK